MIGYWFGWLVSKITGWKFINKISPDIKKFVVIGAPHTSNWDAFYALSAIAYWKIKFKFLIKSELFFFPLGPILKALGGLPVNRAHKNNVVSQCVDYFNKADHLILGIAPEGTRSYNPNWKKGFYYIAETAQVPLVIGYMDYEKKEIVMDHVFQKTGDVDRDIQTIKAFYLDKKGKHPEKGVY